jgi:hypothetical protein
MRGLAQFLSMQNSSGHLEAYAAFGFLNFVAPFEVNVCKIAAFEECGAWPNSDAVLSQYDVRSISSGTPLIDLKHAPSESTWGRHQVVRGKALAALGLIVTLARRGEVSCIKTGSVVHLLPSQSKARAGFVSSVGECPQPPILCFGSNLPTFGHNKSSITDASAV